MKIKKFESANNDFYYNKCSGLILDVFGDDLNISNIKFSEDTEYNFQCMINSITDKSYYMFKVFVDIIEKYSSVFIFTGNDFFAKINNIDDFCEDIKNIKL